MAIRASTRLRTKHIPLRTCAGCHRKAAKRELVRVVRTVEGRVEVDPTGKKAGRGTYLCKEITCWETALKKGRLDYTLKTKLTMTNRQTLLDYSQLFKGEESR